MERTETMPVGIVVERRDSSHPWQNEVWRPVAVIPGAPEADPAGPWKTLRQGQGWEQYLAGTLTIEIHRTETEAYRDCLSADPPRIFVVLEQDHDGVHEVRPFLATVSTGEALAYADAGENIVEGVPMPPTIAAWLEAFIDTHHVEQPFRKRRNRRSKGEESTAAPPRFRRRSEWSEGHEF